MNGDEWLWQSQVFEPNRHYYGACHGVAGNANIFLQAADLLPYAHTELIVKRTVSTLFLFWLDRAKKLQCTLLSNAIMRVYITDKAALLYGQGT